MTDVTRVEYGVSSGDVRRRRRETARAGLRHGADRAFIVGMVLVVAAGLMALLIATGASDPLSIAVVMSPVIPLVAAVSWATRRVRTRPRRHVPPPEWACEIGRAGLLLAGDVDEVTYDWTVVPPVVWEPNWLTMQLPFGEIVIPRDAFADGEAERFAAALDAHRGRAAERAPIPPDAARFRIDPETLDATGGLWDSSAAWVIWPAAGATVFGLAGLVFSIVASAPRIGAYAMVALGLVLGVNVARELTHARRHAVGTRSGDLGVWLDGDDIVERGEGWEHRFPLRRVDAVTRRGPLLLIGAAGTGCVVAADALHASAGLTALVSERLDLAAKT